MSGPQILHASAVALGPAGLLIKGKSGSGKSSLAVELMSLGAILVADDQIEIQIGSEGAIWMRPHERLQGLIEARGIGLLQTNWAPARLTHVVDLATTENARMPDRHETVICNRAFPCLRKVESPAFAAMIMVYLKGARREP